MLSTPWVHNGAGPAKDTVTCPTTVPMARATAKARTTSARAHTIGARATTTGTRAATTGCTREVGRRTVRALMVPSRGTRRVTASLEGKAPFMASTAPAVEMISQEIAQEWRRRRIQGTGSLGDVGRAATVRTRTCSVIATRGATQARRSTRTEEVHDVCGCESQLQGWTSTNRWCSTGASRTASEWEVNVSKKSQKSQKQRKREQDGRLHMVYRLHDCRIPH